MTPSTTFFEKQPWQLILPAQVPRVHPIPEREAGICRRLMQWRKQARLSRPQVARALDVDSSTLVRVEHLRAPLKYHDAWRLLASFELNPLWLATGEGQMHLFVPIPVAEVLKVSGDAPFGEVFDKHLTASVNESIRRLADVSPDRFARAGALYSANPRDLVIQELSQSLPHFIDDIPDHKLDIVAQRIKRAVYDAWAEHGTSSGEAQRRRPEQVSGLRALGRGTINKKELTSYSLSSSVTAAVKKIRTWPDLRDELRKLTGERGAKAKLAREFNVTPQAVSDWLREVYSPEADTVLRLLQWVEDAEAQQKSGASGRTLTPPKTQSKGPPRYEGQKRKGRKNK